MNYKKIYNDIISEHGSTEKLSVYCEYHHILPKCLGGTDDDTNMVYVTGRVHALLHWLLCKIHPQNRKIMMAFQAMTMVNGLQDRTLSTRLIESARKYNAKSRIGVKRSEETKAKISESLRGQKHSKESNEKRAATMKLHHQNNKFNHTEETKIRLSKAHSGKSLGAEQKEKIGDALRGKEKPKISCPHCNSTGGVGAMKRWHFNNCKEK